MRGTVGLIKDSFAKERVGWEEKGSHSEVIVMETFPLAENNCCGFPYLCCIHRRCFSGRKKKPKLKCLRNKTSLASFLI